MSLKMVLICIFTLHFGSLAWSVPHKIASVKKKNSYILDGVFTGGKAGDGYTVMGVRRFFKAKSRRERLVLDIGDQNGRPQKGLPNFFHIALDGSLNRVVVNLIQVEFVNQDAKKMVDKLKDSPYIKEAKMSYDSISMSTTLLLTLTRKVKMETFILPSNKKSPSRIVVDLVGQT